MIGLAWSLALLQQVAALGACGPAQIIDFCSTYLSLQVVIEMVAARTARTKTNCKRICTTRGGVTIGEPRKEEDYEYAANKM